MAVERRVKPSTRARQQLAAKKKVILIGVLALVILAGIIALLASIVPAIIYNEPLPWEKDTPNQSQREKVPTGSSDAVRALLEGSVSYYGTWYEDDSGFQVYIPGTESFEYDGQVSTMLLHNESGTGVFGVVKGADTLPTLGGDATVDANAVMEATIMRVSEDISQGLYGAQFSGSYDVSITQLGDKTPAILVTGDLQTILGLKGEGDTDVQQITYNYPLCAVGFLWNDVPVMVWGVVDADDTGECSRLNTYMEECAHIISGITIISEEG